MRSAPLKRAHRWTSNPTGPQPNTATVSPGLTPDTSQIQ
jgi:hypothetical protein